MLEPLPRGYSGLVWPFSSPMWIIGDIHRTVWLFHRGVFHHPVWFVCFVGVFSVTPSRLIWFSSLGRLLHWRSWRPLSICSASSGTLSWRILIDTCSLGVFSLPVDFHGILNRLILSVFICTGCFCHPLCSTSVWVTGWTSTGACWTCQAWSSRRMYVFRSSDLICRLAFYQSLVCLLFDRQLALVL